MARLEYFETLMPILEEAIDSQLDTICRAAAV